LHRDKNAITDPVSLRISTREPEEMNLHTLTSMSPILLTALIIGRPTIDGNMWAGKFAPAYPHLTNCNQKLHRCREYAKDHTRVIRCILLSEVFLSREMRDA